MIKSQGKLFCKSAMNPEEKSLFTTNLMSSSLSSIVVELPFDTSRRFEKNQVYAMRNLTCELTILFLLEELSSKVGANSRKRR